jgi:hypothetical protein
MVYKGSGLSPIHERGGQVGNWANPLSAPSARGGHFMSELIATTSQTGSTIHPQPETLPPAVVDFVVQVFSVDNPLGLKALEHQGIYQVLKVLVADGEVVQILAVLSSSRVDVRYLVN